MTLLSSQVAIIPLKKGLSCLSDQCRVDDIFKDQGPIYPHAARCFFKRFIAECASVPLRLRSSDSRQHDHSPQFFLEPRKWHQGCNRNLDGAISDRLKLFNQVAKESARAAEVSCCARRDLHT